MDLLLIIISAAVAAVMFGLSGFLFAEVIASLAPQRHEAEKKETGVIAVLVPAHNEADVIAATLENFQSQLRSDDRLIVIADNCSDDTAAIAMRAGAEVVIRNDLNKRGKGYALQHGVDALRADPPEIIIFADADCVFKDGALQAIAVLAAQAERPVQALYLMKAPPGAGPRLQAAEFAWGFINQTRMRGLQRLFGVTRFTGSGFAAPWRQIENVSLASGEIVEDLSLTFELIHNGAAPMFAPDAIIESEFPTGEQALTRQSARWSLGSLRFSIKSAFSFLIEGMKTNNGPLLGAAVDLLVPPLTIFIGLELAAALLGLLVWVVVGVSGPLLLSLSALALTVGAVVIGWAAFGREALPVSALGGLVEFLAAKANVFGRSGRESAKRWTPTRGGDDAGTPR